MYLLNLYTTPKGHLIKIGTFFMKAILIEKDTRSHDVLNGLNSVKFLEILNSNKTPNIFSPDIGEVNCTSGILYN